MALEVVSNRDDEATYRNTMDRHWAAGTGELWFLHHGSALAAEASARAARLAAQLRAAGIDPDA